MGTPTLHPANPLNPLQATVDALAEEIAGLRGLRMTKLREAHVAGSTTLNVESTWCFYQPTAVPRQVLLTNPASTALDSFGYCVACEGQIVVVGAPSVSLGGTGTIAVFLRTHYGLRLWQVLKADDAAAGDRFGAAVAVSGGKIAVGAPYDASGQGAVYVFVKRGEFWTQDQKLTASDGAAGDHFGAAVAIDGDVLVVGAPDNDSSEGNAYVFAYTTTWTQTTILTHADWVASDKAGTAVSISGNVICVGVPYVSTGGRVYTWSLVTTWTYREKLSGVPTVGDRFGIALSQTSEYLAVGATYAGLGAGSRIGRVFVHRECGDSHKLEDTLRASDEADNDLFGQSVALDEHRLWIGAGQDDDGAADAGSVYCFDLFDKLGWKEIQKVVAETATASEKFGSAVAASGGVTAVGVSGAGADASMHGYVVDGTWDTGSVWVAGETEPTTYRGVVQTPGAQQLTGCSPLTTLHPQDELVTEWNRRDAKLDQCRRATLIQYAEGADLDRATRSETARPAGFGDDAYRRLAEVLSYLPRCPLYALELTLDALYPDGGWSIYESLVERPCEVVITIPTSLGSDEEGRTYMHAREDKAAASTTTVVLSDDPVMVESVRLLPITQDLDMDVLPSAESPAWSFVAESSGLETDYFSVSGGLLQQTATGTNSGRYERTINEIGDEFNAVEICWKGTALTTVGGYPWKLVLWNGSYEFALLWSATGIALGQENETVLEGPVSFTAGSWHSFRLEQSGGIVRGYHNGALILTEAASSFTVSALHKVSFGYTDNGNSQSWTVHWDDGRVYTRQGDKNWWNLVRSDGALSTGSDILTSAAGLFLTTDVNKLIFLDDQTNPENYGLWKAIARPGTTQLQLDGVPRSDGIASSLISDHFRTRSARFCALDAGKILRITSTGAGNNDDYPVLSVVSPYEVVLDVTGHPGGLEDETAVEWKWHPAFVTQASIPWELVDAGSSSTVTLTLRDALPSSNSQVRVDYTTVMSAQVLYDEIEVNAGSGARYPFYLTGVSERIEAILIDVLAAGVIPRFTRVF